MFVTSAPTQYKYANKSIASFLQARFLLVYQQEGISMPSFAVTDSFSEHSLRTLTWLMNSFFSHLFLIKYHSLQAMTGRGGSLWFSLD